MTLKRPAAMLLTVALATGTVSALAAPASAGSTEESQFVSLHNNTRASRGLARLTTKSDLVSVARRHSARMAAKGTIWHNPNLASEVGGNWTVLGENVGMGPDVPDLFQAFMDSAPHRHNILDNDYNQFGIGVSISEGTIFVTVVFAKRGASASTPTVRPRARTRHVTARPARQPARRVAAIAKPAAPAVTPRTVTVLVRLVGMDEVSVNPATGRAFGF